MKNFKVSACAFALMAVTCATAMAESVELAVKGAIIPAACMPSIMGEINYGNVSLEQLSETDYTVLDKKELDFAIKCEAPVKLAIKAVNGQPGTVAGGGAQMTDTSQQSPVDLLGMVKPYVVGLGANDGVNAGGYALAIDNNVLTADATDLLIMFRAGDEWFWGAGGGSLINLYSARTVPVIFSWSPIRSGKVFAIENLSGKLVLQAYLNKKSAFDSGRAINLNGLTSIELVYL